MDANTVTNEIVPRAYQLEMLEHSRNGNIIVAMDTGSGKTQIAIMKIKEVLDSEQQDKHIWFLAPTVALCNQHYDSIRKQLPATRIRVLLGEDNVERWGEQSIWDAVLASSCIIISTHAILLDALRHVYVKMAGLSLLVFDEAHSCTRKHAANMIMQLYYHPSLHKGAPLPYILGLSASPAKPKNIQTIERNLDADIRTPRVHRQQLLKHVHRPSMHRLDYANPQLGLQSQGVNILQRLCAESTNMSQQDAQELRKFRDKALHILHDLGLYAAEYFVAESINLMMQTLSRVGSTEIGWQRDQSTSLLPILHQIATAILPADLPAPDHPHRFSSKVERLTSFLGEQETTGFSGLIFVQRRAVASVLFKLLSIHPTTKHRFRCAAFAGQSNNASRKITISNILDPRPQADVLADFRAGRLNLVITTDVLEEGIDVPACRLVVCFDNLPTLKSFVQRRGRARQQRSVFGLMVPQDDTRFGAWEQLEQDMIAAYMEENRQRIAASKLEDVDEEVFGILRKPSTGASIDPDAAKAHLYHFCDHLPKQPYVDNRPTFKFDDNDGLIKATVILPNCLKSSLRQIKGKSTWRTERAAAKDASFQAYKAFHEAGLINDHLLPLRHEEEFSEGVHESRPSTTLVPSQLDPWAEFAYAWAMPDWQETKLRVEVTGEGSPHTVCMSMILPSQTPYFHPFDLYWDRSVVFQVSFERPQRIENWNDMLTKLSRASTDLLLSSTHSRSKYQEDTEFVTLFLPQTNSQRLEDWLQANQGLRPAIDQMNMATPDRSRGLVRAPMLLNGLHVFMSWQPDTSSALVYPLPQRRNFLHPIEPSSETQPLEQLVREQSAKSSDIQSVPISCCTFDCLPFELAQFSLFIPLIMRKMEATLIATKLAQSILKDVPFKDIDHVITALCAPSAQWTSDYQRYEFLGDMLLKYVVSVQLYATHLNWHEGYLSRCRASIVSNKPLSNAAMKLGLGQFVITQLYVGRKWKAPTISDYVNNEPTERDLSRKVLADVVEALIGAAFLDGGFQSAQACMNTFMKNISRESLADMISIHVTPHLPDRTKQQLPAPDRDVLGALLSYNFSNEAILKEALTHPSYHQDEFTESYQRLEFLGDAVLDMIVSTTLFEHAPALPQGRLTQAKAALVNADFLAFLMLDLRTATHTVGVQQLGYERFRTVDMARDVRLWQYMRNSGGVIPDVQQATAERFERLRGEVHAAIAAGSAYPWVLLARLRADKFFSDLVEAILGGIYIDSQGDLEQCRRFVERIGLLGYLRRVVGEGVEVMHPKSLLGMLADTETVDYVVKREESEGGGGYACEVSVGDRVVARSEGCATKDEAVVVAADMAVKRFRESAAGMEVET